MGLPGGPAVKISLSNAGGDASIPGQGAMIPHTSWPENRNVKQKQYRNKFNKDFKNGSHQKNKEKKEQICSESLWLWVAQFQFTA